MGEKTKIIGPRVTHEVMFKLDGYACIQGFDKAVMK